MNVLGQQVANDLAHALETRLPADSLVSRLQFRETLISAGLAPFDLREHDAITANAAQTGATLLLTGRILRFKNSNTLQIDIASLPSGQSTSSASIDLTLQPDALPLLTTPIATRQSLHRNPGKLPSRCKSQQVVRRCSL